MPKETSPGGPPNCSLGILLSACKGMDASGDALARINVEDSIWSHPKFKALSRLLGEEMAIGCLMVAWRAAQEFYKINQVGLPLPTFKHLLNAQALLNCELAEIRDEFVYILGSKEHFSWLLDRSEAGKRGGNASVRAKREIIEESVKQNQASAKQIQPSSSSSSSSSKNKEKEKEKIQPTPGGDLVEIWQKHSGPLPKILSTRLTRNEFVKIRERLEENPDRDYWTELIKKLAANPFFSGSNNRKWKADFLWLIEPGNHVKIATREYSSDDAAAKDLDTSRWK